MNTKQIKKWLIDKDLTLTEMARQLAPFVSASESSTRQMLSDLIYQRRWYPTLAKQIQLQFGLTITRPAHFEPKVRLKQAA